MGNREDLLAAARACLLENGYAATSARDLAERAGVSLAAIGYHFGGKDELLAQATAEAIGDELGRWIASALTPSAPLSPAQLFASFCAALPQQFAMMRPTLLLSIENIVRTARSDGGHQIMAAASEQSTSALSSLLQAAHPQLDADQLTALAKLYFVAINGASLVWLAAPDLIPSKAELDRALTGLH